MSGMYAVRTATPQREPAMELRFRLLGPLEAHRGSTTLELGPPKRRALLLRLLLENGHPVSVDRLCEDLWDGRPPSSAMSSIHAHISRLRGTLEPQRARLEGAKLLRSVPNGYVLQVPPEARDGVLFEQAVHQAHRLATQGSTGKARREVERALELWRGAPLADARDCRFAEQEAARLVEVWLSGEELRTGLLLQTGEIAPAVTSAETLVKRNPLREASWVLLMRALYFAGRPADALMRFESVRDLLNRELGLEPGPALQQTQTAILRHSVEDLQPPAREYLTARPLTREPALVPEGDPALVGRDAELELLTDTLGAAGPGRTAWAVISGGPGMGKTRMAQELAARAQSSGFAVTWLRCTEEGDLHVGSDPAGGDTRTGAGAAALPGGGNGQSLLCVVEDVEHAQDDLLRQLHRYATTSVADRLVVVCTVTDRPPLKIERLLAALAREAAARVPLAPLDGKAVRQLLRLAKPGEGGGGRARAEAEALLQRSGGVPFLLGELLKLPAGRRSGEGAPVPASVSSVLRVRLASLAPGALTAVEAAAIVGDVCDVEAVAAVVGRPVESVMELADEAVVEGLLVWSPGASPQGMGTYRFSSGLLREVVLAGMRPSRRFALHRAAAVWAQRPFGRGGMRRLGGPGAADRGEASALTG
ncbi:BTAD domain-containing putative transcriptional regulator [Streptomyces sp. NPDC001177]